MIIIGYIQLLLLNTINRLYRLLTYLAGYEET